MPPPRVRLPAALKATSSRPSPLTSPPLTLLIAFNKDDMTNECPPLQCLDQFTVDILLGFRIGEDAKSGCFRCAAFGARCFYCPKDKAMQRIAGGFFASVFVILPLFWCRLGFAETGTDAWLRYAALDPQLAQKYRTIPATAVNAGQFGCSLYRAKGAGARCSENAGTNPAR